jgi:hypothetical protein
MSYVSRRRDTHLLAVQQSTAQHSTGRLQAHERVMPAAQHSIISKQAQTRVSLPPLGSAPGRLRTCCQQSCRRVYRAPTCLLMWGVRAACVLFLCPRCRSSAGPPFFACFLLAGQRIPALMLLPSLFVTPPAFVPAAVHS